MDNINTFFEHIITLAGHLAWPATVLMIAFFAREQVNDIISAISDRIRDPNSSVAIGKEGLEIKAQLEAKIESLEIDQEQVMSLALKALNVPEDLSGNEPPNNVSIAPELLDLADQYSAINISNWGKRVRAKDAAARLMADFVITKGVSRSALAGQHHEGLILALAATIHALPKPRDIDHLLRVADEVHTLHVKYRIVLSMSRLIERQLVTRSDLSRMRDVLTLYKQTADDPLIGRIEHTEGQAAEFEREHST